jgi:sortase A
MERVTRIASIALVTAGAVVLLDVATTLAWKEPLSTIYGSIEQGEAEDSLAELEASFPAAVDRGAVAKLADRFANQVGPGDGIGRIRIDPIGLDMVVVEGTDTAELRKGPGHYPETPFPGQRGTIAVAGHRTTYLAPFREIDELERGDEVELEMPYATFTYEIQRHEVVDPSQVEVFAEVRYERLVLTACHPLYSAAQRWAVFARLSGITIPP